MLSSEKCLLWGTVICGKRKAVLGLRTYTNLSSFGGMPLSFLKQGSGKKTYFRKRKYFVATYFDFYNREMPPFIRFLDLQWIFSPRFRKKAILLENIKVTNKSRIVKFFYYIAMIIAFSYEKRFMEWIVYKGLWYCVAGVKTLKIGTRLFVRDTDKLVFFRHFDILPIIYGFPPKIELNRRRNYEFTYRKMINRLCRIFVKDNEELNYNEFQTLKKKNEKNRNFRGDVKLKQQIYKKKKWYHWKRMRDWNRIWLNVNCRRIKNHLRQLTLFKRVFSIYFKTIMTKYFFKQLFNQYNRFKTINFTRFESFFWFLVKRLLFFFPHIPFLKNYKYTYNYWLITRLIQYGIFFINGFLIYQPLFLMWIFDFLSVIYLFFFNYIVTARTKSKSRAIKGRLSLYFIKPNAVLKIQFLRVRIWAEKNKKPKIHMFFKVLQYFRMLFFYLKKTKLIDNLKIKKIFNKSQSKKYKLKYNYAFFQLVYWFYCLLRLRQIARFLYKKFQNFFQFKNYNKILQLKSIIFNNISKFNTMGRVKFKLSLRKYKHLLKFDYYFNKYQRYLKYKLEKNKWRQQFWCMYNLQILSLILLDIVRFNFIDILPKMTFLGFYRWVQIIIY